MNYIGSKKTLLPFLTEVILGNIKNPQDKIFCDLFAGTGIVGYTFKNYFKEVIANDMEYYSYIITSSLLDNRIENLPLGEINGLPLNLKGFITNQYYNQGRYYFSKLNCSIIDTIRLYLNRFDKNSIEFIRGVHYLLESADKVSNVASVYGAYLKSIKPSAKKTLRYEKVEIEKKQKNTIYNKDALELINEISGDVLYIDPPYNERQYGPNYHMLNTIALYDDFVPKGKTGLREYVRSTFCKKKSVYGSFLYIISMAKFTDIFISYNSESLISKENMLELLSKFGEVRVYETEYKKFKSQENNNDKKVMEYLFYLKKT